MSTPSDDNAGDVIALARRIGVALTDADLQFAMELDYQGRQPLQNATDDLPLHVEPAVLFSPPRADDARR